MRKLVHIISSGWLTALCLALMAMAYWYAGLRGEPFALWHQFLTHTLTGTALWFVLSTNLLASGVLLARRRLAPPVASPESIRAMDSWVAVQKLENMQEHLRLKGFSPIENEKGYYVQKGRLSFIPGALVRLGLAMALPALLVSGLMRQSQVVIVSPGETVTAFGQELEMLELDAPLPVDFLKLGRDDDSALLRLEGINTRLSVNGKEIVLDGGGPETMGSRGYRITHLGYRLPINIRGSSMTVNLDVLPPGKSYTVVTAGARITTRLMPERIVKKGLLSGSLYNLQEPLLAIKTAGRETLLKPGQTSVDGSIALGESSLYALVEARRDPAVSFLKAGIFLLALGLVLYPLRLFWYERLLLAAEEEGRIVIGSTDEFFKAWGIEDFRDMVEPLITSKD